MAEVEFIDNRIKVKKAIADITYSALEEAAGELESQVKRNTRVKTGKTKNSWQHKVLENTAYIGSSYENAIWEEFGTGDYALNDDGRKGGWFYEDENGNGHFTHGKKPQRALWNAYILLKSKIISMIQNKFKGL